MTREDGFSLAEVLVAGVVTMTLTSAVVSLAMPAISVSSSLSEKIDQTQRVRVASDVLFQDLSRAGAGMTTGSRPGPLVDSFAPIVPRRMGLSSPDPYTVARADAVTIRYVPDTPSQATLAAFLTAPLQLTLAQLPGCPASPSCGLGVGTDLFLFDGTGEAMTATTQQVMGPTVSVQDHDGSSAHAFNPGDAVAEAVSRTYYFDAAQRQLRMYDGSHTDAPVVDGVTGLTFSYYGDPNPPLAPQPPSGVPNCLYDAAGGLDPALAVLPSAGPSLVPLPVAMFADGPWCGTAGARFDADLLRVRMVRVTLRVEAIQAVFRGQGSAFAHPGTATSAWRALSDTSLTFDVTPRNLNLRR
jgi:hypothetical protein